MAVPGTVGIFATSDGQCVLVSQVNRKEPGPSSSSLRPGDRIVEVDGVSVMTLEDVAERLKERWAGEIVRFAIDRDGARLDLGVELLPRR